jgi:REP element-mobilizing transposase RayT
MPKFDPKIHHRKSIRLAGWDYSQAGAYFVTVVTWQRDCLFGDVVGGEMQLNDFGEIAVQTWRWLETQYPYVELGAWVVMPNHSHAIVIIHDDDRRGGSRTAPTTDTKRKPLGRLIGAFKTVSTKHINLLRQTEGQTVWQRNYYEHVIRNDREMGNIWRYIESNPVMWEVPPPGLPQIRLGFAEFGGGGRRPVGV